MATSLACKQRVPAFDFIGKLGGHPVEGSTPIPTWLECQYYVFQKSREDVEKAARAEFGEPIDDFGYALFVVGAGQTQIRAIVTSRPGSVDSAGLIVIGTHEDLAPLAKRYGWKPSLPESEDVLYPIEPLVPIPEEPVKAGSIVSQTVSMFNRAFSDTTITIKDCQSRGYDCFEPLPIQLTLKPLETRKLTLTYPLHDLVERSNESTDIAYTTLTADGAKNERLNSDSHPLRFSLDKVDSTVPELALAIAEDTSARPLEVRNVRATSGADLIFEDSGPRTSQPYQAIRMPVQKLAGFTGELKLSAEYRRLPNTRWRTATERLSVSSPARLDLSKATLRRRIKLANGYEIALYQDPLEPYYAGPATVMSIAKKGKVLVTTRTRSLIQSWLPDDKLWGSHEAGNQARFTNGRGPLEGVISQVVPIPGGVLAQMGLFQVGPSVKYVSTVFFLRWQQSAPDKWEIVQRCHGGESPAADADRLPRVGDKQFLVLNRKVFRLEGGKLPGRLLTELPSPKHESGWFATSIVGSKALMETQDFASPAGPRIELDLATGEIRSVGTSILKKHGIA